VTPNFEAFGPKECVIQLSIGGKDLTTTWIDFKYFLNTRANKSLAYGPGLLQEVVAGTPAEFQIVARNDLGENRTSGRDNFQVKIKQAVPIPEDKVDDPDYKQEYIEIPCTVEDLDNGVYQCQYDHDVEGDVKISVLFEDDKGEMVSIRGSPYIAKIVAGGKPADNKMTGGSMDRQIKKEIERLQVQMADTKKEINTKDKDLKEVKVLLAVKEKVETTMKKSEVITLHIDQLDESLKLFQAHKLTKDSQLKALTKLNKDWNDIKKLTRDVKKEIAPFVAQEKSKNEANIKALEEAITQFIQDMKKREFFQYKCGVETALSKLDGVFDELGDFENKIEDYGDNAAKFGTPDQISKAVKDIESIKITVDNMKILWDHIDVCSKSFAEFMATKWLKTEPFEMEDKVKKLQKTLKDMKVDKRANAYMGILEEIKKWLVFLPMIAELADQSMRDRHWDMIKKKVGIDFTIDDNLLLKDIYDLNLGKFQEDVEEITDQARQEAKMEKTLAKLEELWKDVTFEFTPHKDSGVQMIRLSEDNFDMLEENQVAVTSMFSSRYLATFEDKIVYWQKSLAAISEIVVIVGEVQRSWSFLENLFIHSEEVRKELPDESIKFVGIDKEVREVLADGFKHKKALDFCVQPYVLPKLEKVQEDLTVCEKALNEFMDSKRAAFPRFYFSSSAELLDILSNGNNPSKVMIHMPKIISAIDTLELKEEGVRPFALGMHACVGKEYVKFTSDLKLLGKVEIYLQDIIDTMRSSLRDISRASLKKFAEVDKEKWLVMDPAMVTLLINNVSWVIGVEKGFL
jgi:dynein heavy chain